MVEHEQVAKRERGDNKKRTLRSSKLFLPVSLFVFVRVRIYLCGDRAALVQPLLIRRLARRDRRTVHLDVLHLGHLVEVLGFYATHVHLLEHA